MEASEYLVLTRSGVVGECTPLGRLGVSNSKDYLVEPRNVLALNMLYRRTPIFCFRRCSITDLFWACNMIAMRRSRRPVMSLLIANEKDECASVLPYDPNPACSG